MTDTINVLKSTGELETYDPIKVKGNITAAAYSILETIPDTVIDAIITNLHLYDKIESREIRRQVENALMSVNKKVAASYIRKYGSIEERENRLKQHDDFVRDYINASNAATGSKFDSNANVSHKNVVTMNQESKKGEAIEFNRRMLKNKIQTLFSKKVADNYIADLKSHVIYKHDETAALGMPYCVSITMYPLLTDGLTKICGPSTAPTDSKSFTGQFVNLVYSVASQFAGAVATPEWLMYFDYFLRKDYGDDYTNNLDKIVDLSVKQRSIEKTIEGCFQQVVHSINMPAGTRGWQSTFWNIGYFDANYFQGVFGDFYFPDGTKPVWESLSWLQKKFMKWFNAEREKCNLTFPVETMAMLTNGEDVLDREYADFSCEMWSEGHSFFCYLSDSPDSLASCCRLKNKIDRTNTHQFSMGTASVATGSKSVMTMNLNRIVQNAVKKSGLTFDSFNASNRDEIIKPILDEVSATTKRIHKYQTAFNEIVKDFYNANMLDVYSAGFISLDKQYLTIGVNGLTDAAHFLKIDVSDNDEYLFFVNSILETIGNLNAAAKTKELMFNTEFVPGENLSNKNRSWDKADGYYVYEGHNMYSSYFFDPENTSLSVLDKMKLHGKDYVKFLDGGSACHINLEEHLSKEQYLKLLGTASKLGTNYFTYNIKNTECKDCGFKSKHTLKKCSKCKSENLDYLTRIIGYLKNVSSFSEPRQLEESVRTYNKC